MYGKFDGVPEVLYATDVTNNSFVANWDAVEDAVEYTVELYKQSNAENGAGDKENVLSEDFMNCTAGNLELDYMEIDNYMSSTGWECENVYSESGVLRIGSAKNPGFLYTPWLEAAGNVVITLDASLYNTGKDNEVMVSVVVCDADENEIVGEDFSVTGTNQKISLSADVDGRFYVVVHTDNLTGSKRVNIDNLNIVLETSVKRELVSTVTTTATSYEFKNLEEGVMYLYRVKASDSGASSAYSDYMEVSLNSTGIDEIVADGSWCEIYNMSGVKVYNGDKAGMPVLSKGVYVVVTARGANKIVIE
jgi:hypothetical protein